LLRLHQVRFVLDEQISWQSPRAAAPGSVNVMHSLSQGCGKVHAS